MTLKEVNSFMKNTLGETLGMEITLCEKGLVEITMPVDHRTHQPLGLLHGGASVALAETAATIGGMFLICEENKTLVGVEINANHIKSIKTGIVKATGRVIHQGKTTQVWEIRITDEKNRLICISRCTLAVVPMGA